MDTLLEFTATVNVFRSPLYWIGVVLLSTVTVMASGITVNSLPAAGYNVAVVIGIIISLWVLTIIVSLVIYEMTSHSLLKKEFQRLLSAQHYQELSFSSWDRFTASKDGRYTKGVVVMLGEAPGSSGVRYRVIEYT